MVVERNSGTRITIDGTEYIFFSGTNYLSLTHRPELMEAAQAAFGEFGFSSSASRITSGETESLLALEGELAHFTKSECAVALPAGFMSNAMVVEAIDDLVDVWIIQKSAHGSIKSALKTSRKPIVVDDGRLDVPLREKHGLSPQNRLALFCEPVEPMSGSVSDVPGYLKAMSDDDFLILDEAHSMGVLGGNGRGAIEQFNLVPNDTLIRTGTFSKAIGTYGGFILAPRPLVDRIRQGNGYKGSTSLSPVLVGGTRASLRLIRDDRAGTVGRLKQNLERVSKNLVTLGFDEYRKHCTPIFSLKSSSETANLNKSLRDQRIFVPHTTGYFADSCEIGLRWTVQAGHSEQDLEKLLSVIAQGISAANIV